MSTAFLDAGASAPVPPARGRGSLRLRAVTAALVATLLFGVVLWRVADEPLQLNSGATWSTSGIGTRLLGVTYPDSLPAGVRVQLLDATPVRVEGDARVRAWVRQVPEGGVVVGVLSPDARVGDLLPAEGAVVDADSQIILEVTPAEPVRVEDVIVRYRTWDGIVHRATSQGLALEIGDS